MPTVSPEAQSSWLIGGNSTCDLIISDPVVSSMHCRLSQTKSGFILIDLNSRNGTWVDGVRLTPFEEVRVTQVQTITLATSVPFPWDRIGQAGAHRPLSVPNGASHKVVTVGRAEDNDVVIDLAIVSSHHARVQMRDGQYYIEDTNSLNGTSINDLNSRITQPVPLSPRDAVFLGSYKLSGSDLLSKFSSAAPTMIGEANFQKVTLKGESMVIGRDPQCDHPLDFPMISWHHAKITRTQSGLFVEDLKSRNGTFVEGKRIGIVTRVEPGQQIGLGSFRFQLLQSGELAKRHDFGYTIEVQNLTVHAKSGKQILSPVSFTVYAGELVALMGTSGSGKTTLLKALNGYTQPSNGTVLYNGKNLYEFYDEYSQKIGYVPQDDIVHERLTVREALSYAARLRTSLSEDEIAVNVKKVAHDLGLTDQLDERIGSPENKTLSGGQRKRVNIGLELICGTPVLFLDEPTSGLSSADATDVVQLLRTLADGGKTIITTIHAPSLEAYRLFDNLLMLSKDMKRSKQDPGRPGALVYYGRAYPDAIQFVANKGAATDVPIDSNLGPEVVMTGIQQDKDHPDPQNTTEAWIARYRASRYFKQFIQDRSGKHPSATPKASLEHERKGMDYMQWFTLAKRNVTVRFRDKAQTAILFLQAPIFALLIAAIFNHLKDAEGSLDAFQDNIPRAVGIHFLMVVAAVWFGCNNAVRDVVGEWLIYQRERMVCLRIPSYIFSKLVVLTAVCLFQCFFMLAIIYPVCHLQGGFLVTGAVLWLVSLVGASIGLLISSAPFCKTTESAIALLPIVLLPMIGLGGGIRPIYQMPKPAIWASSLVATRWGYEANLVREAEQRKDRSPQGDLAQQSIPEFLKNGESLLNGHPVTRQTGDENRHGLRRCIIALTAMFLVCVSGVFFSLKLRDVH